MTGLRHWERDAALPAGAGEPELTPPGEDDLLEEVSAHLLAPGARPPESAAWIYARWKPGVSLCAAYELSFPDGRREIVGWKRYRDDKAASLCDRASDEAGEGATDGGGGGLRSSAVVPSRRVHLWHEPFDRELPGLARLGDMRRTRRLLDAAEVFPGRRLRSHRSRITRLRYRPERRSVLRLDAVLVGGDGPRESSRLAVRALTPVDAARVVAARGALGHFGSSPPLVAAEPRTGLLFESWWDGLTPLGHGAVEAAAGAVVAALHARRAEGGGGPATRDAARSARLFAWHPGLAEAHAAAAAGPSPAQGRVWIHGDLHADQLAQRADGSVALLDLDALRPGHPAEDLGGWIADLLAEGAAVDAATRTEALLDAYRDGGGDVPGRGLLDPAIRCALVDRAAAAVRRLQLDAVDVATRLLDLAVHGEVLPS